MLRVLTGRFQPHLESALADHIRRAKIADPFAPLAVLVPSTTLLERVRRLLAVEQGLSLLNIHFLTFHQLALRLSDEQRAHSQTVSSLQVVDELFFEQLVRRIVRSQLTSLAPLQHLGHSSGTWGALWSTIRDLKDAAVGPAEALQGLREGYFDQDDAAWLHALFSLHAAVKEAGHTLEAGTPDDLAESLIPFVPLSPFVAALRQAFYYGFYDLTQVQLSLFEAVSKIAPTTLFFPLDASPSFQFARRFFDRYVQPSAAAPEAIVRLTDVRSDTASAYDRSMTPAVRSVVGIEEELATVCRTILDLVETNGYRFDEIGVVSRTLDSYRTQLHSIFDRHRIPFIATGGRPLIHEPVCKILLQLASLPLNEFYRTAVLDVVTSPLYRSPLCDEAAEDFRPDLWKLVVPALHITRGIDEWKRLDQARRVALEIDGGEEENGAVGALGIAPGVIDLLWRVVSQLFADCGALPQRGTVSQLIDSFRPLVERYLPRPQDRPEADPNTPASRLGSVWNAIDRAFIRLHELESIGDEMTWAEFVELLTHALERTMIPLEETPHRGVMVLDAMAARGLPFKALFILGLNEKVFPRYIREDAFLRDRHRRVLDATLGFKIDEKLTGYEEETLLFTLLCQAAGHRLYLSFQRADEAGRMLAPSPYLAEAGHRFGSEGLPVEVIPRRLSERVAQRPALRTFLPPEDLALWAAMSGQDPADLLQAVGRDAAFFTNGIAALDRIEDESPALNSFDGLTGTLNPHWSRLLQRGFAPTPLERYARCPFQYFAADVLKLEPIRLPIAQGLDASLLGTLCHAALRRCYERLVPMGWPAEPVTDDTVAWCIHDAVEQAAAECESRRRTGHYLLWELAKESLISLVTAAVEADEAAQAEEPFTPVAFEVDAEGALPDLTFANQTPLKIHGRVDRIDRRRGSGELRIIDYKFKAGSGMKPEDRHLIQAAVRGYRLQPPLYACLTIPNLPSPSQVQFFFLAPNWPAPIARSTFDTSTWSSDAGTRLHGTIRTLVEGIQAGRYFIVPDGYCDTCEFRVACRREHAATWWRAHRAAEPKALRALRIERVKDE